MKKTFALLTVAFTLAASASHAQFWLPGSGRVYTSGSVGVGTTSFPNDAWVHIYGQPSNTTTCPDPSGGRPFHMPAFRKPELWIDRQIDHLLGYPCGSPFVTNLLQVSTTRPVAGATPRILDVINPNGWLGVLQPNPQAPLHVRGNGIIDNDLKVGRDLNVDRHATIGGNEKVVGTLTVNGRLIDMRDGTDGGWRNIEGNSSNHGLNLMAGGALTAGSGINLYGKTSTGYGVGREGSIYYVGYGTSTGASAKKYTHLFLNNDPDPTITYQAAMGIQRGGKVVIGVNLLWNPAITNATPDGYLLFVEKGILTEKLKVAIPTTGNWADYVFNEDYKLMPLHDVESYVTANKHLPDVPSATEVVANGIDVASMDAKLLQKVEELTLYVIQQQKQIDEQNKKIEMLTKQVNN